MAFEAITSAVLNALGGKSGDALGSVSGKAADDPGWLTSTGEQGTYGEGIYHPQAEGFYFKKGQWFLDPSLIPKDEYYTPKIDDGTLYGTGGAYTGVDYDLLGSTIKKTLQDASEPMQQAFEKQYGTLDPYPEGTKPETWRLAKGALWDPQGTGPDPSDKYSVWDDPKARAGLPSVFLPEGVDPYRSITQRALDATMGFLDPKRFGKQE